MHVDRSFKFSVHHVSIIKREYFSFRVVPGEIAKAGRVVVFVPAARPTRCLARFGSPVPNHRLVVPGLLILALTKRGADENEQSAAKQNQSWPQNQYHKMESETLPRGAPRASLFQMARQSGLSNQTSIPIATAPSSSSQPVRRQKSRPRGLSFATRIFARSRPARRKPARHSSTKRFPSWRP